MRGRKTLRCYSAFTIQVIKAYKYDTKLSLERDVLTSFLQLLVNQNPPVVHLNKNVFDFDF